MIVHKQVTRFVEDAYQRDMVIKLCGNCGNEFTRPHNLSATNWKKQSYCSRMCFGAVTSRRNAEKRQPLAAKFETFFARGEGCWEWQGTRGTGGYGLMQWNRKIFRAHVLALELDGRPVPKGMMGCHNCDNPPCVRPSHLYVGTPKQNAEDATARNASRTGSNNCNAKLTEDDVRTIRGMRITHAKIAEQFGVSKVTIDKIFEGKSWRHVL